MIKFLIIFLLIGCEAIMSKNGPMISIPSRSFSIEMLNERGYDMTKNGNEYIVDISSSSQSIFKMRGLTNSNDTERITWDSKEKYYWSNGMVTDEYWVVNPSSYTKNGIGYSMVGFLPKMENKVVVIYGHYYDLKDSVVVYLK